MCYTVHLHDYNLSWQAEIKKSAFYIDSVRWLTVEAIPDLNGQACLDKNWRKEVNYNSQGLFWLETSNHWT